AIARTVLSNLRTFRFCLVSSSLKRFNSTQPTLELEDPCCDPANPKELTYHQISVAHHKIKIRVVRTGCRYSRSLSKISGCEVFIKMEVNQDTGSFKERGGRYALMNLTDDEKSNGVYAASAGNHAQALALHGKHLGVPVTVVMPRHAPLMKIAKCRELGANVLVEGKDVSVSREIALKLAKERGGKYINGYDHIDILAGAGTVAVEIFDQVSDVDAILVPAGGGGLMAGVCVASKALSPSTKVIGLVSESCPSLLKSLEAGKPVYTKCGTTLADGLAVPLVGCNSFHSLKGNVHNVIPVKEKDIAVGILRLLETEKVVAEGAGAIGPAALIAGSLKELVGKKVVCILSGGNIDSTVLGRCIEKGLAVDNRLIRIDVIVSDRPGGVAEFTQMIANMGASVKDMALERAFHRSDAFTVNCSVVVETRDEEHAS
ncbi:hypothetical protein Angca_006019, partial [Angiostrongylus cantonensis]